MSYLIKDTSKEERKMPSKETIDLIKEYINGKMELEEVQKRIIEKYKKG